MEKGQSRATRVFEFDCPCAPVIFRAHGCPLPIQSRNLSSELGDDSRDDDDMLSSESDGEGSGFPHEFCDRAKDLKQFAKKIQELPPPQAQVVGHEDGEGAEARQAATNAKTFFSTPLIWGFVAWTLQQVEGAVVSNAQIALPRMNPGFSTHTIHAGPFGICMRTQSVWQV